MPDTTPILLAIDALKGFVRTLKKRPDVKVEVATFGKKAPAALLKSAEAKLGAVLGGELMAFYGAMNGVEIRWSFIEGPGGGLVEIPPLTSARRFEAESEHCMGFGAANEALFLDGTGDGGAWIVRAAGSAEPGEIIFAMAAEGEHGVRIGSSLAAYLNAAIDAGGVVNWPACRGVEGGSFRASEASLRKFKAAPVKPQAIRPNVRVQVRGLSNQGRGEVIEVMEIGGSVLPVWEAHVGVRFVKVALDQGFTAWMPEKYMKAVAKPDPYERLRGNIAGDDVAALLEDLACAVGPAGATNAGIGRDNALRGAGLLGAYTLSEAFERTFGLYDTAVGLGLDLVGSIALDARKDDLFLASDFARAGESYRREDPLIALIGGFRLLLTEAAVRANTSRAALLTPQMVDRLRAYGSDGSASVYTEIRILRDCLDEAPRPVPWASHHSGVAKKIGLGVDELLFVGS